MNGNATGKMLRYLLMSWISGFPAWHRALWLQLTVLKPQIPRLHALSDCTIPVRNSSPALCHVIALILTTTAIELVSLRAAASVQNPFTHHNRISASSAFQRATFSQGRLIQSQNSGSCQDHQTAG
ncbi:hypothetical protein PtB15_17B144 [Puccinia triticina]|nr:hypothetical protein PtB15_17B144 [Puccinia triticina]